MDENRLYGTARNVGGKVEEGVGRSTGDAKTQIQGKLDQAAGATQDLYGQTADAARDTAANLDKWLRTTIETQPYTTRSASAGSSAGCTGRSDRSRLSTDVFIPLRIAVIIAYCGAA